MSSSLASVRDHLEAKPEPKTSPPEPLDDALRRIEEMADERLLSDYLTPDEATLLRDYFGTLGMSALHRSSSGAELDRANLYSRPTRPCKRCGGDERTGAGGCGWMPRNRDWREPGPAELALLEWERAPRLMLPPAADVPCDECDGKGWVERRSHRNWRGIQMFWVSSRYVNGVRGNLKWEGPYTIGEAERRFYDLTDSFQDVTIAKSAADDLGAQLRADAYPTGSSVKRAAGAAVGDVGIQRIAIVGRRLDLMTQVWSLAVQVMDSFYGPEDGGHITSVWPLTAAGKTLLRRNKSELPAFQFFENERSDQAEKRDLQRRSLFDAADQQAKAMLRAARLLWNIVSQQDDQDRDNAAQA